MYSSCLLKNKYFAYLHVNKLEKPKKPFQNFCLSVCPSVPNARGRVLVAFHGRTGALVTMKLLIFFFVPYMLEKIIRYLELTYFWKRMAAVQKLALVRLYTCFVRFSRKSESTDHEKTFFLCAIHAWEGYWLLGTVLSLSAENVGCSARALVWL